MFDEKLLSRVLIDQGIYSNEEFARLLTESKKTHENLESYLLRKKYLSETKIYQLLAQILNLSFTNPLPEQIPDETLLLIPEGFAISHSLVAYKEEYPNIFLATSNPNSLSLVVRDYIAMRTKRTPKITITSPNNIHKVLRKYPHSKKQNASFYLPPIQPQEEKKSHAPRTLKELGIFTDMENHLKQALSSCPGIIFITGEKQSGKTTLLQTLLNLFEKENHVIYTMETKHSLIDSTVSQIQKQKSIEDYLSVFSTLLHCDSTLFFIDGLYDFSIMQEALRAAESGRTVLISWEAPTLGSAFLELSKNGVPFSRFQKSMILAMETHLMKRICSQCIEPAREKGYRGKGCAMCDQNGFRGYIGTFSIEVHNPDPKLFLSMENDLQKKVELGLIAHEDALSFS